MDNSTVLQAVASNTAPQGTSVAAVTDTATGQPAVTLVDLRPPSSSDSEDDFPILPVVAGVSIAVALAAAAAAWFFCCRSPEATATGSNPAKAGGSKSKIPPSVATAV